LDADGFVFRTVSFPSGAGDDFEVFDRCFAQLFNLLFRLWL